MKAEPVGCLRINCPELFNDPAFTKWLNAGAGRTGNAKITTWHRQGQAGECSDVFVTYDHGEGSDACHDDGMPAECWDQLVSIAEAQGIEFGVLWLTNLTH